MSLAELVLQQNPPPARVLEVGCGDGALARELVALGYDVLAIDPDAPEGPIFRQVSIEELEEDGTFDVVVADRMLHHVEPLEPALDKLARLAPALVLEEFAWERIDARTQGWYEALWRRLAADGLELRGPPDLDEWRSRHPGLLRSDFVLEAIGDRYEERFFERRPYFFRWLRVAEAEAEERAAIDAGEIEAIGLRYAGVRR